MVSLPIGQNWKEFQIQGVGSDGQCIGCGNCRMAEPLANLLRSGEFLMPTSQARVKWAGGKRQLLDVIDATWGEGMEKVHATRPMIGGGYLSTQGKVWYFNRRISYRITVGFIRNVPGNQSKLSELIEELRKLADEYIPLPTQKGDKDGARIRMYKRIRANTMMATGITIDIFQMDNRSEKD